MSAVPRKVVRFILLAVASYALLLLPWPGRSSLIVEPTRALTRTLFGMMDRPVAVQFDTSSDASNWVVTARVSFERRISTLGPNGQYAVRQRVPARFKLSFNTYIDFLAIAMVLALTIATPLRHGKRSLAYLSAAFLSLTFVFGRRVIAILAFASAPTVGLQQFSPQFRSVLGAVNDAMITSTESAFVAAIAIWLLCVFPRCTLLPEATVASAGNSNSRTASAPTARQAGISHAYRQKA